MEKVAEFIFVISVLLYMVYTYFIPYNINKIAKELEGINKSLKRIADKEE
ncbi:MAG: hypothetical protein MR510_08575 [Clostridium sp.]|nr:hypothetical protein [Clostridium sp.]